MHVFDLLKTNFLSFSPRTYSECDFGYVGANCSIVCQCNGHSNCQGPDQLDVCLECHNNTIGNQCEQCMPLFVGDPVDNGECVSCFDYCHGHTDLCVERSANMTVKTMNRDELLETLTRGPVEDAICLGCKNRTTEDRCEGCMFGHFRGSEEYRLACRKCHCQVCIENVIVAFDVDDDFTANNLGFIDISGAR